MLKRSFFYPVLFLLVACNNEAPVKESPEVSTAQTTETILTEAVFDPMNLDTLKGIYQGNFDNGMINIIVSYLNPHKAVGYNVHRGLQRNLFGDVQEQADKVLLTLSEPGDHPFDGVFHIEINKKDFSMSGKWVANDPKIGEKKFTLKKQVKKNPDEEMSKHLVEANTITADNFIDNFGYATNSDGDYEFREDGSVVFHWIPSDDNGNHTRQETTIRGNWQFTGTNTISVDWQANKYFQKASGYFELVYDDEGYPRMKIEGRDIYPNYW